jgi:nitrogen fixation protein FixH
MNQPQTSTFNPWPWLPVIVLGITVIPSLIFVMTAHRLRLGLVEELPYQSSVHYDVDKQSRSDFRAAGYHFAAQGDGPLRLRFQLAAPVGAGPAKDTQIALYRPDDLRCDRVIAWPDPTQPLVVSVQRPGLWRVRLSLNLAGPVSSTGTANDRVLTDETAVDAPEEEP